MNLRTAVTVVGLLVLHAACRPSWPPGTVARWDGGSIDLKGIELYLKEKLDSAQAGEDLVRQYREAAREICARKQLLHEQGADVGSRFDAADRELTRRRITVAAFVTNRLKPEAEITPEEIQAYYAANPGYSHRPERRFIEHIFRRTGDETKGASAQEVLAEVRARYLDGDSFQSLAVEYSQSATGVYGGGLGLVARGDLHQAAEDAVFALEIDEISKPVQVHGGLAVFVVTQIYPAKDFPLEDVSHQIEQQLRQDKLRRRLDAIAEEARQPPGVRAVPEDEFLEALESDDPEAILYSDNGLEITVDDWRRRQTRGTAEAQLAQYTDFLRLQNVYHFIVADGFLDEAGRRTMINERFDEDLNSQLVNIIVRERLIEEATRDRQALLAWYDDNRERNQSQIELLINLMVVAPKNEIEVLDDSLRAIGSNYTGGDLEQAAHSIQGAAVSRAWVYIDSLDAYPPRVKASILTVKTPGCTPVFNIAGALHLFCLEERKEPKQLSFEEAYERVVEDYVAANQQEIYEKIRSEILDDANFEFNENRVREVLHAPATQDSNAS